MGVLTSLFTHFRHHLSVKNPSKITRINMHKLGFLIFFCFRKIEEVNLLLNFSCNSVKFYNYETSFFAMLKYSNCYKFGIQMVRQR